MPSTRDNVCAQCGQSQVDDQGREHLMLQAATRGLDSTAEDMVSIHLDCLSYQAEQHYRDAGYGAVIDAAKAGVRCDELRAHLPQVGVDHREVDWEAAEKASLAAAKNSGKDA